MAKLKKLQILLVTYRLTNSPADRCFFLKSAVKNRYNEIFTRAEELYVVITIPDPLES